MAQADYQVPASDQQICFSVEDGKKILSKLKDCMVLEEVDRVKDQRILVLEKEISLLQKESELKDMMLRLKDEQIKAQTEAIERLKEITDRAMKLAEVSKPKIGWSLLGLGGIALFLLGLAIGL